LQNFSANRQEELLKHFIILSFICTFRKAAASLLFLT
jgi:hypothetical protein